MPAETDQVIGVISPRSKGGLAIFECDDAITSDNVEDFTSDPSDVSNVCDGLTKLGFSILAVGPTTISFSGTPKLFKDKLGTKVSKKKTEVAEELEADFFGAADEEVGHLLEPPQALAGMSEGIALAEPPELFESALPPIAAPHAGAYRYFFAPDEVAVALRAARVHRLGITGRDIVVAMIDTGHYRHPFFTWRGYRLLSTLLGPGKSNPSDDMVGHGTGESANIFSAAPDIRLRPIKGLSDPVGDFAIAVGSTPKPHVITNSWGYDVDRQSWLQLKRANRNLYNYLKALEAAVASAVASGIVVCVSCGNGTKRGFPGSHPQVISVGGVHVNLPDLNALEASSYASSFPSSLYPGRHCPDLCGLTGNKANINGATRAPSIMLPVQPGASLDAISPSTGSNTDGWGLFSGTSAACPQVAGVVALMLEKNPGLSPAAVKQKLIASARDVTTGTSGTGETAGPGSDNATGAGLVDAKWAHLISMGELAGEFMTAAPERQREMVEAGQIPRLPKEVIADMIDTLRSR